MGYPATAMLRRGLRRWVFLGALALFTVLNTACFSLALGFVINEDGSGTFSSRVLMVAGAGADETAVDFIERMLAQAPPGYEAQPVQSGIDAGVEFTRAWSNPAEFPSMIGDFASQILLDPEQDEGPLAAPLYFATEPALVRTADGWRVGMVLSAGALRDTRRALLEITAEQVRDYTYDFGTQIGEAIGGAIGEAIPFGRRGDDSAATPVPTATRPPISQEHRDLAEMAHDFGRQMRFDVLISMPGDASGTHNADEVIGSTLVWHVPLSGTASKTIGAETIGSGAPAPLPPPGTNLGTIDESDHDGNASAGDTTAAAASTESSDTDADADGGGGPESAAAVSGGEEGGVGGIVLGGVAQPPEPRRAATAAAVAAAAVAITALLPALLTGASGAAGSAASALGAGAAGAAPVGGGDEFEELSEEEFEQAATEAMAPDDRDGGGDEFEELSEEEFEQAATEAMAPDDRDGGGDEFEELSEEEFERAAEEATASDDGDAARMIENIRAAATSRDFDDLIARLDDNAIGSDGKPDLEYLGRLRRAIDGRVPREQAWANADFNKMSDAEFLARSVQDYVARSGEFMGQPAITLAAKHPVIAARIAAAIATQGASEYVAVPLDVGSKMYDAATTPGDATIGGAAREVAWITGSAAAEEAIGELGGRVIGRVLDAGAGKMLADGAESLSGSADEIIEAGGRNLDEGIGAMTRNLDEGVEGGAVGGVEGAEGGVRSLDEDAEGGVRSLDEDAEGGARSLAEGAEGGARSLDEGAEGGARSLDEGAEGAEGGAVGGVEGRESTAIRARRDGHSDGALA